MTKATLHNTTFRLWLAASLGVIGLAIGGAAFAYRDALMWRYESTRAALLDWWSGRADTVPAPSSQPIVQTPAAVQAIITSYEEATAPEPAILPTIPSTVLPPTPEPPPLRAALQGFRFEYQTINNCGPATMATMLSYWGWKGSQADVARVIKPVQRDKNVRWDEMVYYVKNYAGWLDSLFRASGTVDGVKPFIANGYPVIIATGYTVEQGWVGHYLLLTGYDDEMQSFTVQDAGRSKLIRISTTPTLPCEHLEPINHEWNSAIIAMSREITRCTP